MKGENTKELLRWESERLHIRRVIEGEVYKVRNINEKIKRIRLEMIIIHEIE